MYIFTCLKFRNTRAGDSEVDKVQTEDLSLDSQHTREGVGHGAYCNLSSVDPWNSLTSQSSQTGVPHVKARVFVSKIKWCMIKEDSGSDL